MTIAVASGAVGSGGTPTAPYDVASAYSRPYDLDRSWRTSITNAGGTVTRSQTAGFGSTPGFTTANTAANQATRLISGPLGYFDCTFGINVTSYVNGGSDQPSLFAIYPACNSAASATTSPNWCVYAVYNSGTNAIDIYTDPTGSSSGATKLGSLPLAGASSPSVRVRRDAKGYLFSISNVTTPTTLTCRREDVYASSQYGLMQLALGKVDLAASTITAVYGPITFTSTPADAMGGYNYGSPLFGPPRGATDFDDAVFASELTKLDMGSNAPSGSLPNRWWYAVAAYYGNSSYIFDQIWMLTWLRDLGDIETARATFNNYLAQVQSGATTSGLIPQIVTTTGPDNPYGTSAGQAWCQGYFAYGAYLLAHDGDLTWLQGGSAAGYAALKNSITWIETNRKTSRGLFTIYNGQEVGWDGMVGTNPSEITNDTPNRWESLILSSNMYLEYVAMEAIANQLGNTGDAATWASKAATLKTDIQTLMWNATDGWFEDCDTLNSNAYSGHRQANACHAMFAGIPTVEQMATMEQTIMNPSHFLRPYGITSLDATDSHYQPTGISPPTAWVTNANGPVWEPVQYMMAYGLYRYGYVADAMEIARRSALLYRANVSNLTSLGTVGEWHDPETGIADPASHFPCFGWHALIIRLWRDLKIGYDPMNIQSTSTTVQGIGSYDRPV